MDTKLFSDFLALAETRNFTRASEMRHVSQAAFSRRIQSLEDWAGVQLVERGAVPIRLTSEGQRLRVSAAEILTQIGRARRELAGERRVEPEHIRLGITATIASMYLPAWWEKWTAESVLSANLVIGTIYDLVTALASNSIDLLIVYEAEEMRLPLDRQRYTSQKILDDVLEPYGSRTWLEQQGVIWPGSPDLPIPLLMWTSGEYFSNLVQLAIRRAPSPIIGTNVLENGAMEVLRAMTGHGYGVSWLPRGVIDASRMDCSPLGRPYWSLPISITAFRAKEHANKALDRLWPLLANPDSNR